MNRRFPLLSIISKLLSIVGWLLLVLGGLRFTLSLIALVTSAGGFSGPALLIGGGVALAGLAAIGAGESIGVFFAIEDNTRAAAEHLYKLASEKITPKT
jgi:hypothetical protein